MINDNIYSLIDALIDLLRGIRDDRLAKILEHRMYKVSWTCGSELLEEISSVLGSYVKDREQTMNPAVAELIREIQEAINSATAG